jgi:hypothetical protein
MLRLSIEAYTYSIKTWIDYFLRPCNVLKNKCTRPFTVEVWFILNNKILLVIEHKIKKGV